MSRRSLEKLPHTSRRYLGTLAGAAVIVSVLCAELGARVGETACSACGAAKALGMKAGPVKEQKSRTKANS